MIISSVEVVIPKEVQSVWKVVLDVEGYAQWRSDLQKAERIGNRQFVEYTKGGYPTTFTVTCTDICRRWEFDMENSNMTGHWTGIFDPREQETVIHFTEQLTVKKFYLRPFVRGFLKRQQKLYVEDLKKALQI